MGASLPPSIAGGGRAAGACRSLGLLRNCYLDHETRLGSGQRWWGGSSRAWRRGPLSSAVGTAPSTWRGLRVQQAGSRSGGGWGRPAEAPVGRGCESVCLPEEELVPRGKRTSQGLGARGERRPPLASCRPAVCHAPGPPAQGPPAHGPAPSAHLKKAPTTTGSAWPASSRGPLPHWAASARLALEARPPPRAESSCLFARAPEPREGGCRRLPVPPSPSSRRELRAPLAWKGLRWRRAQQR